VSGGLHPRLFVTPGQRYGRLTVVEETRIITPRRPQGYRSAICVCDCDAKTVTVEIRNLYNGRTQSCGCLQREQASQVAQHWTRQHGLRNHPLYGTWNGMMRRCYTESDKNFTDYGGRGIYVTEEWHDVRNFIAWIEKNLGPRPEGMTLDRINNDGPYASENVRWASMRRQSRNRRTTKVTEAEATDIRRLYESERHLPRYGNYRTWTMKTLAAKFETSTSNICQIINDKLDVTYEQA
jgi:hypothetical protein